MRLKRRQMVLGGVLAVMVFLALTVKPSPSELVPVAAPRLSTANAPTTGQRRVQPVAEGMAGVPRVLRLQARVMLDEDFFDTFAVRSWQPPPPPAPAKLLAVAAPPRAPRAPFTLIGRYEEEGRLAVFVEYQQRSLVARAGELLNPEWQVESIGPDHLVLQYLPLAQKQVLAWGKAAP